MKRAQMRAARALLGWSQEDLGREAGISLPTVRRIEPGDGDVRANSETIEKIEAAFKKAGLELLDEMDTSHGEGFGVRFRETIPETLDDIIQESLQATSKAKTDLTLMVQSILSDMGAGKRKVEYARELLDVVKNYDRIENILMDVFRRHDPDRAEMFDIIRDVVRSTRKPKPPSKNG